MATNLALDDELVAEAKRLGHHKSKRAAVNDDALAEYVARRKQRAVVALFGTVTWDESYDYKHGRRRR